MKSYQHFVDATPDNWWLGKCPRTGISGIAGMKVPGGREVTMALYRVPEGDRYYGKGKEGTVVCRYLTETMLGSNGVPNQFPLVAVNVESGLVYFLAEDGKNLFETKGTRLSYLREAYQGWAYARSDSNV